MSEKLYQKMQDFVTAGLDLNRVLKPVKDIDSIERVFSETALILISSMLRDVFTALCGCIKHWSKTKGGIA